MDIGSLFLGLALLLIVAFIVARPLIERPRVRERQTGPADELLFERERLLTALRDLDFDFATGKLVEEDYTAQRAQLVAQGVAVLKQLDALGVAPDDGTDSAEEAIETAVAQRRRARTADGVRPASATAVDEAIEARVAQRRGASPAITCAQCGATARPADRFCPQCGGSLAVTCSQCGRVASAGDQFCGGCGQPLTTTSSGLRQARARS